MENIDLMTEILSVETELRVDRSTAIKLLRMTEALWETPTARLERMRELLAEAGPEALKQQTFPLTR